MDWSQAQQLALALGLGLLVGLQREWTSHVAGIRTFALVTVYGALMGMLIDPVGPLFAVFGLVAVAAVLVIGALIRSRGRRGRSGLTTHVAALIMYSVGVAIALDQQTLAVIVGGGVAVLLQWKRRLHVFVDRIGEQDIRAIFQLVLISLVVLPVLPNRAFGPYGVINPYEIWLMVVLICGISVSSYLVYRFFGSRAGTVVGGILGGLISSTATTVSYSRHTKNMPETAGVASLVIMIASSIVFGRVIVEIAIVAPEILQQLVPPLVAMMALMIVISLVLYLLHRKEELQVPLEEDPSDLKTALLFGLLYAVVLLAVAIAKEQYGDRSLYIVAALSGLTDMDAITLSTAQLIKAERLTIDTGWRMILVGSMSNLVFKACAVALLGHRQLLRRILLAFSLALAGGAAILVLWP